MIFGASHQKRTYPFMILDLFIVKKINCSVMPIGKYIKFYHEI